MGVRVFFFFARFVLVLDGCVVWCGKGKGEREEEGEGVFFFCGWWLVGIYTFFCGIFFFWFCVAVVGL